MEKKRPENKRLHCCCLRSCSRSGRTLCVVTQKVIAEGETLWKPNWPRSDYIAPCAYVVLMLSKI